MKKFLISLLLLGGQLFCQENAQPETSRLSGKDLEEHALFWVKQMPSLEEEEIALLANYLYFESLLATYECAARHALVTIHTASIRINKQLMNSEDEAKNIALATAHQLKELNDELLPARSYALKASQECLKEIEKSDFTSLKKVVVSYQQYSRAVLAQFIKQDKPAIESIIGNCHKQLDTNLKKMLECQTTLQQLLDHKNPYVKDGMDPDVVDMDVALAAGDVCLGCMNEMTLACTSLRSMSVDLLSISTLVNKIFYQTFYQANNKKHTLDIMFNEQGLIDEEDRDEALPPFDSNKIIINKKHLTA